MSNITIETLVSQGIKLTPMMDQYYQIKKAYPDTLLLFRMGDFYEVFFEDARKTSQLLNITLTHRGKLGDTPIPMAGIPHHAASAYIDRLAQNGIKVAICEQVQDPKDAVGIVKRAVTQVVSPGMPFDYEKTQSNEHRYLASAIEIAGIYFLSYIDFTTGEFKGTKFSNFEDFIEELRLIGPKEFITFMGQWNERKEIETLLDHYGILKTYLSEDYFNPKYSEVYIEKVIPGFKRDKIIEQNKDILSCIGALSYYICSTQLLESFVHIKSFQMQNREGTLKVTLPTLTGLEILPRTRESYKESLLGFMDKTNTAMGARLLKTFFTSPLTIKSEIENRQTLVQFFVERFDLLKEIKTLLSDVRDIERILTKISINKATSSDLINLSIAAESYFNITALLHDLPNNLIQKLSEKDAKKLKSIASNIAQTLNDEIGASLEKGNLIKAGIHPERDRLFNLHRNVADELLAMENRLKEETGIAKLRVKSNNVFGFFIEVPKGASVKVPKTFDRRQTLVNAERYVTPELLEFEREIVTAKDKLEKLEREIFKGLIEDVTSNVDLITKLSFNLSLIDVFQSFAYIALQENFSKPEFSDEKLIHIESGFHPLIKSIIKDQFVTHDLLLNNETFFGLITGPNMAGKTTVMREVAIIQLLAQIGSFVPAKRARLSLCDFLFSRLGASDDILKGQSTFMVEMAETAEILRHATDKSLIILDEVGRGTSTYDGLSIAWALVEHFIEKTKALCLFATHYHELIDVVSKHPCAKNLTVETINHKGNVQFLYRLIEEGASQSFGIYVAKLAGIPNSILKRSESILRNLEKNHQDINPDQLSLFDNQVSEEESAISSESSAQMKKIEEELNKIDLLKMTPIDAMVKLNELKNLSLQ